MDNSRLQPSKLKQSNQDDPNQKGLDDIKDDFNRQKFSMESELTEKLENQKTKFEKEVRILINVYPA
jgi:hypothetical protein